MHIAAQQRTVNQIADTHGIGIGGMARIELERLAFDAGDEITRRSVGRRITTRGAE
jgi:hypothetical protein